MRKFPMSEIFKVPEEISENAHVNEDKYEAMYNGSISQPDIFWAVQSKRIDWIKKPTKINKSEKSPKTSHCHGLPYRYEASYGHWILHGHFPPRSLWKLAYRRV